MIIQKTALLSVALLVLLSACTDSGAGSGQSRAGPPPNSNQLAERIPTSPSQSDENVPTGSNNAMGSIPWSMVGSVTIVSNGTTHEPNEQFQHAGVRTPQGLISGSPPAPPPIEEFLRSLPEIQYSDDFQVVIDGEYARNITYALYKTYDYIRVVSQGQPRAFTEDLYIPDGEGEYILTIDISWSDLDPEEYVRYWYSSILIKE